MKHVSYLQLDRMLLGAVASPEMQKHVAGCAECQAYLSELERQRLNSSVVPAWALTLREQSPRTRPDGGAAPRPRHVFLHRIGCAWLRRPAFTAGLLSAVAFGGWLWLESNQQGRASAPYVASKGGDPEVGVYVLREGRVFRWNGRDAVRAGDRIRLGVAPAAYRHVVVCSRSGADLVTLYRGELQGAAELPRAWSVDAEGDAERLTIYLSERPLSDAELLRLDRERTRAEGTWTHELVLPKTRGGKL